MTIQFLLGIILSSIISLAAWRVKSLSLSGAWAAFFMGSIIFGLGGIPWAALLLTFFISSSLLSRLFTSQKSSVYEKFSKGSQRDWGQVLANGGLGTVFVIYQTLNPHTLWPWIAYIGAMAAVNADTWATELGIFNRTLPRLITTGIPVEKGTSGGVSLIGYLAATGAALLVAVVAFPFTPSLDFLLVIFVGVLGGVAGSSLDSWLGATLQAIYFCPACHKETERHPEHSCGTNTHLIRGARWLNNDWVNFFCGLTGAVTSTLVFVLLH